MYFIDASSNAALLQGRSEVKSQGSARRTLQEAFARIGQRQLVLHQINLP